MSNCRRNVTPADGGADVWMESGAVFVPVVCNGFGLPDAAPTPELLAACAAEGISEPEIDAILWRCEEVFRDLN